ncbi:hypothetical protein [Vibrio harveyi]
MGASVEHVKGVNLESFKLLEVKKGAVFNGSGDDDLWFTLGVTLRAGLYACIFHLWTKIFISLKSHKCLPRV